MAAKSSLSFLLTSLNLANNCDQGYKSSKNQRLHVELCLMKISQLKAAFELVKKKDD